ncbi:MAG: arginine--tRNA ligase, partial [Gemmataceae bacterium]|nr:arginine--tRNA ligase [Gemmataceae bacterium]
VMGKPPRDIAALIVAKLEAADVCEPPTIAGPGFINLKLKPAWLGAQLQALAQDERLGVEPVASPRTFVVDFSSPNVAKPLHVGHLRSTIIGDALARLLRFLGHTVVTDNHLGDWGTQFGILIWGYKNRLDRAAYEVDPVAELARLYVSIKKEFKSDEEDDAGGDPLQEACRAETAKLHAGDAENLALWREFMPHSLATIEAIYQRLDIAFDHTLGESYYQPMLADVVRDLQAKGLAVETDGALGIFLSDKEGDPPALVRKSDGAFTYTTTDLATIKHRVEHFKADHLLYVVDSRQALHFKNLFEAARRWGCAVPMEHVGFGTVLDENGKPFSTGAGGAPLLEFLLDQATAAAARVFDQSIADRIANGHEVPTFTEAEKRHVHAVIGTGAVKYFDLSQNRISDYRFILDKMTSTEGNTATYMQYAYARTRSIFRKDGSTPEAIQAAAPLPSLNDPKEQALALHLLRFPEALESATSDWRPNLVTNYLWDLSRAFSAFFEGCPVLKSDPETKAGRLLLCDLTGRVIRKSLDLLGIQTVERM